MARRPFGGGGDAVVIDAETGAPMPFAAGTAWTARSGGTQLTDVADEAGITLPSSQVVTDSAGAIAPFLGPDDETSTLWMDFGGGTRFLLVTTDLAERLDMIESGGAGYVPATRTITAGTGLSGGGPLSTNLTIDAEVGTDAGTLAAGDHTHSAYVAKATATTKGDLLVATGSATVTRLPVGTNTQVLTADSAEASGVKWASVSGSSGIPASTVNAKGDLLVATADDTVTRLAVGTNDQVLTADSAQATGVKWATLTTPIAASAVDAKGDILTATANDTPARLAVGSNGQMLVADSTQTTGLRWAYTSTVVVTLTDGATINTDASAGTHFRVTLGGNRALANPTNMVDGQRLLWEIVQDATGGRTLSFGSKFAFGTDITGATLTTTASKRDFLGGIYHASADKIFVLAFARGY